MSVQITGQNRKNRRKRQSFSDINITPFVDVLLVLLIIFMVAAPMMNGSVDVSLPKGKSKPIETKERDVFLTVKSNGGIIIGEEEVNSSAIPTKLRNATNGNFSQKIYVKADRNISYGRVMEVIKEIGEIGFSQVILVTDLSK